MKNMKVIPTEESESHYNQNYMIHGFYIQGFGDFIFWHKYNQKYKTVTLLGDSCQSRPSSSNGLSATYHKIFV